MKLNNKGFAITGIMYAILLLFIILVVGILVMLGNRKILLDRLKFEIVNKIEGRDIYKDDSGANQPILLNNMVPVKYDGNNWIVADIHQKWYDYDNKEWANAVILMDNITKNVGDLVDVDSEVALMYVWIPRYKYTIWNGNNGLSTPQEINITFESGVNTTGTVKCVEDIRNSGDSSEKCTTITNGYSTYTHPAFTFDKQELTGFWIGKFELSTFNSSCLATGSTSDCNNINHLLAIIPNVSSLKNITADKMFELNIALANDYRINNGDSHMIKNMEWGAVTYLMHSKYGRCENGVCTDATPNRVGTIANNATVNGCASEEITDVCNNPYNTTLGQSASSTGNIYGVYDLNGGAGEVAMAFNYATNSLPMDSSYYDVYTSGDIFNYTRGKLGDATKEIVQANDLYEDGKYDDGWYNSPSVFVDSTYPMFVRGGMWDLATTVQGSFSTVNYDALESSLISSRNVLIRR